MRRAETDMLLLQVTQRDAQRARPMRALLARIGVFSVMFGRNR